MTPRTLTVITHIPRHHSTRETRARCGARITPSAGAWISARSMALVPHPTQWQDGALTTPCKRCAHIPRTWRYRP